MVRQKVLLYSVLVLLAASVVGNIALLMRSGGRREKLPGGEVSKEKVASAAEETGSDKKELDSRNSVPDPLPKKQEKTDHNPYLRTVRYSGSFFDYTYDSNGHCQPAKLISRIYGFRSDTDLKLEDVEIKPMPKKLTKLTVGYDQMQLEGIFDVDVKYSITIPSGLKIFGNFKSTNELSFSINGYYPDPYVKILGDGIYYPLPAKEGKITYWPVTLSLFNVKKIRFTLYHQDESNLDVSSRLSHYWWNEPELEEKLMVKIAEQDFDVKYVLNRRLTVSYNLASMVQSLKPGMYRVRVMKLNENNEIIEAEGYEKNSMFEPQYYIPTEQSLTVVLSDLGISASLDELGRTVAVSVRSLSTRKAVQGADVVVKSIKRQLVARGKTGEDGCVLLKFIPEYDNYKEDGGNEPHTVIVKKDGDISSMRLVENNRLSTSEFNNEGRLFRNGYYAFLYSERGIYRPGETVVLSAFLRDYKDSGFEAVSVPFELRVVDSRGKEIFKKMLTSNVNGYASVELPVSKSACTGTYTVKCGIGKGKPWNTYNFQVGAFIPDRIKVEAKPEKEVYSGAEKLRFSVSSRYYFGSDITSTAQVCGKIASERTHAKHWKDYVVGNMDEKSDTNWTKNIISKSQDKSDCVFEFDSLEQTLKNNDDLDKSQFLLPLKVQFTASVTEPSSRTVSSTCTAICLPNEYYLGLKHLAPAGHDAKIKCKLLTWDKDDIDSLPAEPVSVSVLLLRKEWDYVLTASDGNKRASRREWIQVVKDQKTMPALKIGRDEVIMTLPDLEFGNYQIVMEYNDKIRTCMDFWHWEGEAGSVRSANPLILTAKSDKESYKPGDIARITFDSPSAGYCMVCSGERRMYDARAFDVKAGENSVTIQIPQKIDTGRYFVSLALVYDKKGDIQRSFALLNLAVDLDSRRMKLKLSLPSKAEPKEKIKIKVKAAALDGKPASATLQLFAVDEGILSLTDYKTPDIFDFFHGKYYTDFTYFDIYSSIIPSLSLRDALKTGGDGKALANRLKDIKLKENAIAVLPVIEVPETGEATVDVNLPDFVGEFRVMAVAANKNMVGSADESIKMRSKASVMASMPVAVAVGDEFTASYMVFNTDADSSDAALEVILPEDFSCKGEKSVKLTVPKGKNMNHSISLNAKKNGIFTIKYILKIGTTTVSGEDIVNVRPANPFVSDVKNVVLKPGESLELGPSADSWEEEPKSRAVLSPSPALGVTEALEWLNNYPYGCLEQTTSKAFPFLGVDNLLKAGLISRKDAWEAAQKVNASVQALLDMKRGTRGFAGWADCDWIWTDASIYAAHFLLSAKTSSIPESAYEDIQTFLHNYISSSTKGTIGAYALYVLSLSGSKGIEELYNKNSENAISRMDNFLLGAALVRGGFASKGIPVVKAALDSKPWEDSDSSLPWFLSNAVMRKAMVLTIAMDMMPEHPALTKLAFELNDCLRKDGKAWGSTRENAWASMGLAAFAAYYKPGKMTVTRSITGKDGDPVKTYTDKATLDLKASDRNVIKNVGDSSIFVRHVVLGIPKEQIHGKENIKVTKKYLDSTGKEVKSVKHGELVTVKITVTPKSKIANAVLLDLLPGGFEIENEALASRAKRKEEQSEKDLISFMRREYRDDRFLLFGDIEAEKEVTVSYNLRAVTVGNYAIPQTQVEAMYEPDVQGTSAPEGRIEVIK